MKTIKSSVGQEFIARLRGHRVVGDSTEPDLAISIANIAYGAAFAAGMVALKRFALKGTAFGDFSMLKLGRGGA